MDRPRLYGGMISPDGARRACEQPAEQVCCAKPVTDGSVASRADREVMNPVSLWTAPALPQPAHTMSSSRKNRWRNTSKLSPQAGQFRS